MYIYMIPIVVTPNFTPALAASPCYVFFFFFFVILSSSPKAEKGEGQGGRGRGSKEKEQHSLEPSLIFFPFSSPTPARSSPSCLNKKGAWFSCCHEA